MSMDINVAAVERLTEYHAGVAVIKDKTRQKEAMAKLAEYENTGLTPEEILDGEENLIKNIDFAIAATGISDHYTIGMSNGMKYIKSLIDGKAPIYDEDVSDWIPVEERLPKTEYGYAHVMVSMDDDFVCTTDYTDDDGFEL